MRIFILFFTILQFLYTLLINSCLHVSYQREILIKITAQITSCTLGKMQHAKCLFTCKYKHRRVVVNYIHDIKEECTKDCARGIVTRNAA